MTLKNGWQITALEDAARRISLLAREHDLATPVDHLSRWKVRDVVAHLGGIHLWATRIVQTRSMDGPGFKKSKLDGVELCDWFDAGAEALIGDLRALSLDEPCPNFNPGSPPTIEWWARRQAHESTVHRWDVEQALDQTTPIEAAIAADGIDEFLDVFIRTRGKQTLTSTLVVRTTRPRRVWTLTPASKPGRIDVAIESPSDSAGDESTEVTEVSGPPGGLLLGLWGRCSVADAGLTITGEPSVSTSLFVV